MKNNYFIIYYFIALFLLIPQFASTQTDFKLDSIQTFLWNDPIAPNDWLMKVRDHFTYDNGGVDWTGKTSFMRENNTWQNSGNIIRTYNANDKLVTEINQVWNGSEYTDNSKNEYSYDGSGNNDLITYYFFYGVWMPNSQELKTYNGSNQVTEITQKSYNPGTTLFDINNSQYRYMYSNDLLSQEDIHFWNGSDWGTPFQRINFNYNGTLPAYMTIQEDTGSGLENTELITYTYNGNNFDTLTFQTWDGSNWVDYQQAFYTYNANDLMEQSIVQTSTGPSTWENAAKVLYYWSGSVLSVPSENLSNAKAYPNPFISELNVMLKSSLESQGTLSIFNVHGKEISRTELNQGVKSIQLNYPSLSKGIYFIKISSESQNQTFKVIKQ